MLPLSVVRPPISPPVRSDVPKGVLWTWFRVGVLVSWTGMLVHRFAVVYLFPADAVLDQDFVNVTLSKYQTEVCGTVMEAGGGFFPVLLRFFFVVIFGSILSTNKFHVFDESGHRTDSKDLHGSFGRGPHTGRHRRQWFIVMLHPRSPITPVCSVACMAVCVVFFSRYFVLTYVP